MKHKYSLLHFLYTGCPKKGGISEWHIICFTTHFIWNLDYSFLIHLKLRTIFLYKTNVGTIYRYSPLFDPIHIYISRYIIVVAVLVNNIFIYIGININLPPYICIIGITHQPHICIHLYICMYISPIYRYRPKYW